MWVPVRVLAKKEGLSRQTIQKRIKEGYYSKVKVTDSGHFRVWLDNEPELVLYGRVSDSKSYDDIERQKELLLAKYPKEKFIYDIGSGFNFERRGFKTILERAIGGIPQIVVVSEPKVLTRAGFTIIRQLIELSGGRIEVLNKETDTEKFSSSEFIHNLSAFVNSSYGNGNAKRKGRGRPKLSNNKENKNLSQK